MSITISGSGVAGITIETDPTALKLTGGTLSGKLNATTTATSAGVNLGFTTANPTSLVAGDVWVMDRLNYTNRLGNVIGTVSTNQISTISTSSGSPILQVEQSGTGGGMVVRSTSGTAVGTTLRIEQRGTGNALVVEDSTTPDGTAFTIDQHGKVGIGVAPDSSACLRVDFNGIKFADGSTQTTSYSVTNQQYLADSIWLAHNFRNCSLSGFYDSLSGRTNISYSHPVAEALINAYNSDIEVVNSGNGYPIVLMGAGFIEVNGDQTGQPLLLKVRGITLTGGEFIL